MEMQADSYFLKQEYLRHVIGKGKNGYRIKSLGQKLKIKPIN